MRGLKKHTQARINRTNIYGAEQGALASLQPSLSLRPSRFYYSWNRAHIVITACSSEPLFLARNVP